MKTTWNYLKNREETILFLLSKPSKVFTPATFHKLRLEIKKLDAFFSLLKFCNPDFKRKKTFRPFRKIFKQAGKVRDLQVQESILKDSFGKVDINAIGKELKKRRTEERTAFFALITPELSSILKKKLDNLDPFIRMIIKKRVVGYLEKKQKKIRKLLKQNPLEDINLHDLRRRIKKKNYIKSLISKSEKPDNDDDVESLLGAWHDNQIIRQHFKKALDANGNTAKEITHLKQAEAKAIEDGNAILLKLTEALR